MSTSPLKRIYFVANMVRGWPRVPNDLSFVFRLAEWMKAERYMPKVVDYRSRARR
jgi:hypothetical protein